MKHLRQFLAILLVVCMLPLTAVQAHPFTDVPVGCWFEESVDYVYENGLMNGTSGVTFSPEQNMNRAMVVTVLYRMVGSPDVTGVLPFTDIQDDAFYTVPLKWAYQSGIVMGISSTEFAPNASVNRSQLVTFFYRFAEYLGCDMDARADLSSYTDAQAVPAFAQDAFSWAVAHGIVQGVSSITLSPAGTANRAQCATILCRVATLVGFEPDQPPVTPAPTEPPESYVLSMNKTTMNMEVGDVSTIVVTYTGTKSLSWTSSNEAVATINNGEVTAIAEGVSYVTVTDGTKNATCKVIVDPAPTLTVNVTSATIYVGETYQVDYTYTGDKSNLTWRSRNESVATVDSNGVVTAVAAGNSSIVVSDGTNSETCRIKVEEATVLATDIVLVGSDGPIYDGVVRYKGDYITLEFGNKPNAATREVVAASSDNNIVSVSDTNLNGSFCQITLNFNKAGTATITMTSGDGAVSKSYTITVKDDYSFNPGSGRLSPEEFADYTTRVMCANGFTEATCTSWRLLTLTADELRFYRAVELGQGMVHDWWVNDNRYCQIVYIGQDENGNYQFHTCWG